MNAQTAPIGSSVKSDRDSILSLLSTQLSGARLRDAQTFAAEFLRRLPTDDLAQRTPEQWAAAALGALDFTRERRPGAPKVRVFNAEGTGVDATRTIVEIVTDDMPFFSSTRSACASARRGMRCIR